MGDTLPIMSEPAEVLSPEQVVQVLHLFEFDATEELWWRSDEQGRLRLFAQCNDVFAWACADCEEIRPDQLEILAKARADVAEATEDKWPWGFGILFAARVRGMRPQGAMYKHLDKRIWPLLDACGPEREPQLGNPEARPTG